jgi:hypothetical protein
MYSSFWINNFYRSDLVDLMLSDHIKTGIKKKTKNYFFVEFCQSSKLKYINICHMFRNVYLFYNQVFVYLSRCSRKEK